MKLLYIALCDLEEKSQIGIKKKIKNQINSLKETGTVYLYTQKGFMHCIYEDETILMKKVLLTYADIYADIYAFIIKEQIENVYIRYLQTNPWLNQLLRNLKQLGTRVILEFPTIPYDEELKGRVELEEDVVYRGQLKKYVKMSTNYNGLKNVFGIPSIPLQNGIDVSQIQIKKRVTTDTINLLAVATMNYWHGYDRLIKGLVNYYKKGTPDIILRFTLIGAGSETGYYQSLIDKNGIEDYVKQKGAMYKEELEAEYDNADIAIGTLGMYRINVENASPIKTKEYCARGIPVLLGHEDLAFDKNLDFICKVPNNDTDIDIEEIIRFYEKFKKNGSGEKIRQYALDFLTWDQILKPVKKYYQNRR